MVHTALSNALFLVFMFQQPHPMHCERSLSDISKVSQVIQNNKFLWREAKTSQKRDQFTRVPKSDHFVDQILDQARSQAGVSASEKCDDLTFLRRVTLDLTGRLPTLERTLAFMENDAPDKRERYTDELLASIAFVDRWAYWMGDLFQSNRFSLYEVGNMVFHEYLAASVYEKKPLDVLVRELVSAGGNSFESGPINYRVRASESVRLEQDRNDNTVANYMQTLLGVQGRCISCHDGFYLNEINLFLRSKTRRQFWEMAAFVANKTVDFGQQGTQSQFVGFTFTENPEGRYLAETTTGDRPPRQGGPIDPVYLAGSGGVEDGEPSDSALARLITDDRQFARNLANRLWAQMMVVGLVEPLDEFDLARLDPAQPPPAPWAIQPSQPALLEALTDKLIEQDFNLRAFLKTIILSETYQQAPHGSGALTQDLVDNYVGRSPRRLDGEELFDAINVASGVYYLSGSRPRFIPEEERQPYQRFYYYFAYQKPDMQTRGAFARNPIAFIDAFGSGDRYNQSRSNNGSLDQALIMMNQPLITNRLGLFPKIQVLVDAPNLKTLVSIARAKMSVTEKIRRTYLSILIREPTAQELDRTIALIGKRGFAQACEDLHWILFNHIEFLFNY